MARLFKPKKTSDQMAWVLNQCEEIQVIGAYEEIARFVPAEERWGWQAGFETAFYERGLGVFHFSIKDINEVRKRKGLPLVVIEETGTTEYARETSRQVVAERRRA